VDIAKAFDWQALTKRHSFGGDGTATAFPLPADFDRMPIKSNLYSTRSTMPLARVHDLDQWLEFEITPVVGYPGYWIILGNEMQVKPPPAAAEDVRFYYVTSNIWRNGSGKPSATADADEFILNERLLTLALIWRWRQMKRLEYGEDMNNYQIALNEEIGRDGGSRIMRFGRARIGATTIAFPGELTP
jgi:hypothetical protein